MKTTDFSKPANSQKLNENLYKKFGVKVDLKKYTREQLEDARNKIRTELSQVEARSNFNDLLTNETYQKNKHLVGLLNTRIKEMLGESIALIEKKLSSAEKKKKEEVVKSMKKDKKGFKDRYGDRGEEVMHATATKLAKKVAEGEKTEGNAFGKAVSDAKKDGIQKGEKVKVGGKEYPVKETEEKDRPAAKKTDATWTDRSGKKHPATRVQGSKTIAADKEAKKARKAMDKDLGEGNLPGSQEKIDVAEPKGKITGADLAALRKGKKKSMKESQHKQNVKLVNESIRRLLAEDEEGKAKAITAGTDMVNDFTSWMTRVGQYQTKSMIELADAIRANFGQEQAETFKQAVSPALETALNTLTQAREQLSNAVAVLAGESSPTDTMGADMGGMESPEAGMDSMNAGNEEVPTDDFGAADAAAGGSEMSGREMRENRKLFAEKLNEAHSIIARLSK